jgi:hypothetical protein
MAADAIALAPNIIKLMGCIMSPPISNHITTATMR